MTGGVPDRVAAVAPPDRRRPLLEVVDEALTLQADADAFIRAVAAGHRVDSRLIRQGGRLASAYLRLRRQARAGRPPAAVADQIDAQLDYHHQMVETALQLADTRGRPNAERQRQRLRGLGSAAQGRQELRAWLAPGAPDADETGVEGAVAGRAG